MRVSAGVMAGWLALAAAGPVAAATRTVTVCTDSGAAGEARQVLQAATDGDLVMLPGCRITLGSRLEVLKAVSLQGAGAGRTILDGNGVTSVLFVGLLGSDLVRIADLSIVGGSAPGGSGGGLFVNGGSVHLDGVEVSGSQADGGGGIFHGGAVLTVTRSRISGNRTLSAGAGGGILLNGGSATLTETAVVDNHADGVGARGGGIFQGGFTLTVSNSLVAGNTADGARGGGIYENGGRLFVTGTTFDNNRAAAGGAIWAGGTTGALVHVTLSGNSATEAGGALETSFADLVLQSSILARNSAPLGANCNAPGSAVGTAGHNLADDDSCGLGGPNDRQGLDPLLGDLADNGGPTATRALLAGSPALDSADPVGCPGIDQRGIARPQGPGCDVGAFEAVPAPPPPPPASALSLSPPSGAYLSTQVLDFTIIIDAPGRSVVDGLVLVDGLDLTPDVVACVRTGALLAGGQTFHCPGVPAAVLGTGSHTVTVSLVLDDGTSLSHAVVWEILPAVDL